MPLARAGHGEYVLADEAARPKDADACADRLPMALAPGWSGNMALAEDEAERYTGTHGCSLIRGLDAFAEQFRAQSDLSGLPSSEHAVHFCLALGLQAAWRLPAGTIVFERLSPGRTRTDMWIAEPHDIAIEVKYLRGHPSGTQSARPMHYGQLLADFNKVVRVPGRLRLIVLAADHGYTRYVEQRGGSILPLHAGETSLITPSSLGRLVSKSRQKAESHGPWRELRTTLRWTSTIRECSLFVWEVAPEIGPTPMSTQLRG